MQSMDSVSKGYFVYTAKKQSGRKKVTVPDPLTDIVSEDWHSGYSKIWRSIVKKLNNIEDGALQVLLKDLVNFIQEPSSSHNQISTAILLTGVNLPDHSILFNKFRDELKKVATPHIVMLSSCDCSSIKNTVEQIVSQFMKKPVDTNAMEEDESDEETEDINVKKSDCNLPNLVKWYEELNESKNRLVIVIKDFEGFQPKIICQLILILSGYIDRLPLILVFGVATTEAAIGEYLTHKITSRLKLKVFQSQPSVYFLNNTVDKVFLSPDCPFQLAGKLFNFFTSVFLFYDFSVNRFIQGVKYCVMDHFYQNKAVSLLCQKEKKLKKNVRKLDADCLKQIRETPSFKKHIDDSKDDRLLTDDEHTQTEVLNQMLLLRKTIAEFYTCLRVLYILVKDLPQAPFGKQFREVYCMAMSKDVCKTSEYKECHQLLKFLSKDELESKLIQILDVIRNANLSDTAENLEKLSDELKNVGLNSFENGCPAESPSKLDFNVRNRSQLKKKLAEMSLKSQKKVGYEAVREAIVDYIMGPFLTAYLSPYTERTVLWELITLHDINARNKVVPRIRGPIHTALNNPHHYLMCDCCKIQDDAEILPTMPDICIAYKLHLEGGPLINLYDWLQSFSTIVQPDRNLDNPDDVDPTVQARFTQAIAELEFLGFIKSSKLKPDHVSRLTWGSTT